MTELDDRVREICKKARVSARKLAPASRAKKDAALEAIARTLEAHTREILAANAEDLEAAKARGTKGVLLDRLMLDEARVRAMASSVREIAALADPVGEVVSKATR